MSSKGVEINDGDMPILFRLADSASAKAQSMFVFSVAADLVLIVLASVLGAFAFDSDEWKLVLGISGAVFMTIGLFLTNYIRTRRFEQDWYDGRAIAESVKTRAWRFMMCSEPYSERLPEEEVRQLFLNTLKEVRAEREEFSNSLGTHMNLEKQITDKMMVIRKLPLLERRSVYLNQRINDQRKWYSSRSGKNRDAANSWFLAVICAQFLAVVSSIILIKWSDVVVNLASIFAAVAAVFIAWIQLKRHSELANSYGLASQELGSIAEQVNYISEPEKFSAFILDAENAISREHTLWIARRDTR